MGATELQVQVQVQALNRTTAHDKGTLPRKTFALFHAHAMKRSRAEQR